MAERYGVLVQEPRHGDWLPLAWWPSRDAAIAMAWTWRKTRLWRRVRVLRLSTWKRRKEVI